MTSTASNAGEMPPIVQLRGVTKKFNNVAVLDAIDFEVRPGEVCAFIGPSGSGKTTLLRCVNGLTSIDDGAVIVNGHTLSDVAQGHQSIRIGDRELSRMRSEIGFVFQHFNLFPHLTALGNITLAMRKVKNIGRAAAEERARELLSWVSLSDKADTLPGYLSGGQKQRVAIARALAMDPKVMLFDEVTSALDPERVGEVLEVIGRLAQRGMTMLIVTHEMNFARGVASRVVFMEHGKIVEQGPPDQVFGNPRNPRTISFLNNAANPH